jgi:hypothetical protein
MWDAKARTWKGIPEADLKDPDYSDFLDYRHDLATAHKLNRDAQAKAEALVEEKRMYHVAYARELRAAAERLIEQAYAAERLGRPEYWLGSEEREYYKAIRDPIEDAGYWAARKAIGLG